jgi:hypothetical protein
MAKTDPQMLPRGKTMYAVARHILAGRTHHFEQRTRAAGYELDKDDVQFVITVPSVEFWGTTWSEVAAEKGWES